MINTLETYGTLADRPAEMKIVYRRGGEFFRRGS